MPTKPISEAKWAAVRAEMREILIATARQRQAPLSYSELCSLLQTAYVHYHSHILVRLLDEIGAEEERAGRPALPALVVRKQTGMPGPGYFRQESGRHSGDEREAQAIWEADLAAVYDYWSEQA